jgi:membrane-bound inhibitor of C-type lysozyme
MKFYKEGIELSIIWWKKGKKKTFTDEDGDFDPHEFCGEKGGDL